MEAKVKNFGDSYLYKIGNFEKELMKFMMSAEVIKKDHPSFEDIKYDVKRRQVTSSLMKVLMSDNIVLLRNEVEKGNMTAEANQKMDEVMKQLKVSNQNVISIKSSCQKA